MIRQLYLLYTGKLKTYELDNVNTRICNISSGPHITHFSAVVAKKQ